MMDATEVCSRRAELGVIGLRDFMIALSPAITVLQLKQKIVDKKIESNTDNRRMTTLVYNLRLKL